MNRFYHQFLIFLLCAFVSTWSVGDEFDPYREVIDNYRNYTLEQRNESIRKLESINSDKVEKDYLLGMLYFIQAFDTMRNIARSKQTKPKVEDVLAEPIVSKQFKKAEEHYDSVENTKPGYKYIYCKYAELYRYSFNESGLISITKKIGDIEQTKFIKSCKKSIEDIAIGYASHGYADISREIFLTAINNWKPYPKFMLEAMGDIDNHLGNGTSARKWWKRCAVETEDERKQRCEEKLK